MNTWIFAFVAAVLVVPMLLNMRGRISGAEARRLVKEGARLIDVRTPGEFAQGHIDGAHNIPVQDLPKRLKDAGPKQGTIVVYCRSGARSARAATLLRAAGYTKVSNLGGMGRW